MGQSTVVATAFTAIMFVAGVSILIMTTVSSFGTLSLAMTDQATRNDITLSERIKFGEWELIENSTIHINVTNIGATTLMMSDFNAFDLILAYDDGISEQTSWINYDPSGTSASYWRVQNVYFRNRQQDLINPIHLEGNIRGGWDPEETLELEIQIDEESPVFQYLSLITPSGFQIHTSFTKEHDSGKALIYTGTKIIVVSHLLDRVPRNIQVTPCSEINTEYWVEAEDNDSFTIHLSNNPPYDILFYWYVE